MVTRPQTPWGVACPPLQPPSLEPPYWPPHLHHVDVLARRHAVLVEAQPLLDLLLHLLAECRARGVHEAVDARGDAALVGQVPADAPLVALLGAPDEGRVEDEPVLGRVAPRLERPWRTRGGHGGTRCHTRSAARAPSLCAARASTAVASSGRAPHLKSAFSAPRICTVLAGYFARLVRLPAWLRAAATQQTQHGTNAREHAEPRAQVGELLDQPPGRPGRRRTAARPPLLCQRAQRAGSRVGVGGWAGGGGAPDEAGAHHLADERRQVGRHRVHLLQQVRVQLVPAVGQGGGREDGRRTGTAHSLSVHGAGRRRQCSPRCEAQAGGRAGHLYSASLMTRLANISMLIRSMGEMSWPMLDLAASSTCQHTHARVPRHLSRSPALHPCPSRGDAPSRLVRASRAAHAPPAPWPRRRAPL